jgi:5'-methylthioadenosine phosphorylase
MTDWVLGVIGGSGLYDIPGLEDRRWEQVGGPWGEPSDELLFGTLNGAAMVFLPRHGRGHRLSPTHINGRANIDALKRAGCTDLVSLSAVGSLREDLAPGTFVVIDQFIDRTFAREKSFFGQGVVAHVSMADPVCQRLSAMAAAAGRAAGATMVEGGTYLAMEGPQFSTRAKSLLYRSWGCDVIGMTNMPEAKLAREAELPYACVAMVTDYDCWRAGVAEVEVARIVAVLNANADKARALVARMAGALTGPRPPSPIDTCLGDALITPPAARDPALVAKLDAVAGRALKGEGDPTGQSPLIA